MQQKNLMVEQDLPRRLANGRSLDQARRRGLQFDSDSAADGLTVGGTPARDERRARSQTQVNKGSPPWSPEAS